MRHRSTQPLIFGASLLARSSVAPRWPNRPKHIGAARFSTGQPPSKPDQACTHCTRQWRGRAVMVGSRMETQEEGPTFGVEISFDTYQ